MVKFVFQYLNDYILSDGSFVLDAKTPQIPLSISSSKNKLVYTFFTFEKNKNILVRFGDKTNVKLTTPNQMSISIYNTDMDGVKPIALLQKLQSLPLVAKSDTGVMRIEFSDVPQELKMNFELVDESSCYSMSSYAPSFELNSNSSSSCSWLILPDPSSTFTVINPTIVDLPKDVILSVTYLSSDDTKTYSYPGSSSTLVTLILIVFLKFIGPISKKYLPDFVLNSSLAYEFTVNGNKNFQDLQVVMQHKVNTFKNDQIHNSVDNFLELTSVNYPGYYPIGFTQNIKFNYENMSLITVKDMQLDGLYSLYLTIIM